MKKKIIIVSRSFYPVSSPRAFRTTELVKEFAKRGHEVTLLTIKDEPIHKEFEKEHGVKIKDLGSLALKPIGRSKGNRLLQTVKKGLHLGLRQMFEYPDIELTWRVRRALKNESGYDLLISIAAPHPVHWGVARVRSRKNPIADVWAADCGDPYMGFQMDRINKAFYFKYVEKDFCRKADYITVPFEGAKDAYYPEFRDKLRVIPQGFNFDEIQIDKDMYEANDLPTFAYAGDLLGGGRNPFPFLDYLVNKAGNFKFIVYTRQEHVLKPYLERAQDRIEIRGYVPRSELLPTLSKMDFLVNFNNLSTSQLPSKLIDYYLTGRPVLSIEADTFDEGLVHQFLNGDYRNKFLYDNVESYRIENVCDRFLNLTA